MPVVLKLVEAKHVMREQIDVTKKIKLPLINVTINNY